MSWHTVNNQHENYFSMMLSSVSDANAHAHDEKHKHTVQCLVCFIHLLGCGCVKDFKKDSVGHEALKHLRFL